jgi:hypothetical protein
MGLALFNLGGLLCLSGMLAWLAEFRLCQRIVRATAGREDCLTSTDTWLNTRQFRKRKKLREIVESDPDASLRNDARRALRLDVMTYALFIPGMILMAAGAWAQG